MSIPGSNRFKSILSSLQLSISSDKSPKDHHSPLIQTANKFDDKYTLKQKLGEGAHCAVFSAENLVDGELYAVKIFRTMDEEMINIIKKTYQIQQMTNNAKHFLKTYDLYLNRQLGVHHLVTEYCQLPTLQQYIGSEIELNIQQQILRNLVEGVNYLHHKRICHRDIKPDNILTDITTGDIKIIDFGVAKLFGGSNQTMMTPTGDPRYRAPEVTKNLGYSQSIDVWAIGLIALQMFTQDFSPKNKMKSMHTQNINLSVILQRTLEVDPSKRIKIQELLLLIDGEEAQSATLNTQVQSNKQKRSKSCSTIFCKHTSHQAPKHSIQNLDSLQHLSTECSPFQINMTLKSNIQSNKDLFNQQIIFSNELASDSDSDKSFTVNEIDLIL